MAKQRKVQIAAGAGWTEILATIPAHYMKVYEEGERLSSFDYQWALDDFDETFTTGPGDPIEVIGHGRSGIIARPPNYNGVGHPATGDTALKIRDTTGTGLMYVIVYESESEL